jgi:hypothetical protein
MPAKNLVAQFSHTVNTKRDANENEMITSTNKTVVFIQESGQSKLSREKVWFKSDDHYAEPKFQRKR